MQEPENDTCAVTPNATSLQKFSPSWTGPIEGYAKNQIHQLLPRVHHFVEYDDLLQDAFEIYLYCRMRYTRVDNAAWFMALFKRVLYSRHAKLVVKAHPWVYAVEFTSAHEDLLIEYCVEELAVASSLAEIFPLLTQRRILGA